MKCIYCDKEFDKLSDEHIIHNALGGLLTSRKICCGDCNNNLISKNIDVPFSNIFAPFVSLLDLKKSHSASSKPTYKAIATYNGKEYEVICKEKKIIECVELKKELKDKFDKSIFEKMEVTKIKFNLDNKSFKQGLSKIALNYAIDLGIDIKDIKGVEIEKENNKVKSVKFNQLIIPFIPITLLDNAIEDYKEDKLYHSLILFNNNRKLWCYVELFSTFKFYILLNNDYKGKDVNEAYCQLIEKQDRSVPYFKIRRPKDVLIIADQYQIEPTLDEEELNERVKRSILSRSNKQDFHLRNQKLIDNVCVKLLIDNLDDNKRMNDLKNEFNYYIDRKYNEDDQEELAINVSRYRVSFVDGRGYPDIIMRLLSNDKNVAHTYHERKFNAIGEYITKHKKR